MPAIPIDIMTRLVHCGLFLNLVVNYVTSYKYENSSLDAVALQLDEFRRHHPRPIGVVTLSAGEPIEIRKTVTLNSDLFTNEFMLERFVATGGERIPERIAHAKGNGAFGYFEVTNDVSKYTNADVFNGIGKKTPLFVRFSGALQRLGGHDLNRDPKGMAVKFYTKQGILDFICLNIPIFFYRKAHNFVDFRHAFRRNPKTGVLDSTMAWDFLTQTPEALGQFIWLHSDTGIPNGYRKMDVFPTHTYEISNQHGERHYVKFNFRTEQGLENLTSTEALALVASDPDYFGRDLYNSIKAENYPSWRLEMDVMTVNDVKNANYNPFDVTVIWKKGTYHTVKIGRLVVNEVVENHFRDVEQAAFNPGNLVPGIPGPVDFMFKARIISYLHAAIYRLGVNHNKIDVNLPVYAKTHNRDGLPPVRENMKDAQNYYSDSFNGPIPYVDETRPNEKLIVLESNAADFGEPAYFYNNIVENNAHRQRIASNLAMSLENVSPKILQEAVRLLTLIEADLGRRVTNELERLWALAKKKSEDDYVEIGQCIERNLRKL